MRLPAGYVAEHVELAYAQTGHAAQGRTVDHSLLVVDGNIDNRGVYVPLTRGRHSNHAYVALEPDDPRTPRDVLAEAVCRDWADIPAIIYRQQLQLAEPDCGPPVAVPQRPLEPSKLREVARGLAQIDLLDVPFQQGELQRAIQEAARQRNLMADAVAELDAAKTRRDQVGEQLVGMSPWNPFAARRRHQLEHDNHKAAREVSQARRDIRDLEPNLAAGTPRSRNVKGDLTASNPNMTAAPNSKPASTGTSTPASAWPAKNQPRCGLCRCSVPDPTASRPRRCGTRR